MPQRRPPPLSPSEPDACDARTPAQPSGSFADGDTPSAHASLSPTQSSQSSLSSAPDSHGNRSTDATEASAAPAADPTRSGDTSAKREEAAFSLRHFLNRSTASTSPQPSATSSPPPAAVDPPPPTPKSTGARPKVPQPQPHEAKTSAGASARMKRSPKFASFDSQASLAEFDTASPSSMSLPSGSFGATGCRTSRHTPGASVGGGCILDESPLVSPSTAAAANFQRSFSTFDIGGGGKRYNIAGGGAKRPTAGLNPIGGNAPNRAGRLHLNATAAPSYCDADEDDDDGDDFGFAGFRPACSVPLRDLLLCDDSSYGWRSRPVDGVGRPLSPDVSSALPDFVQDHILLENLYGGEANGERRLPDFAPDLSGMPFDLMCSPGAGCEAVQHHRHHNGASSSRRQPNLTLDLPTIDGQPRPGAAVGRRTRVNIYHDNIPLDLTARNEPVGEAAAGRPDSLDGMSATGGAVRRTLPDFLADGHVVRNAAGDHVAGLCDVFRADAPSSGQPNAVRSGVEALNASMVQSLRAENSRLRCELDDCLSALAVQRRRNDELSRSTENANRDEMLRQMLQDIRQRPASVDGQQLAADERVSRLEAQVNDLQVQLQREQAANAILRQQPGTNESAGNRRIVQESLASEMLLAATTAENSIRQLMSGVENLRLMARRMEGLADTAGDPDANEAAANAQQPAAGQALPEAEAAASASADLPLGP